MKVFFISPSTLFRAEDFQQFLNKERKVWVPSIALLTQKPSNVAQVCPFLCPHAHD